MADDATLIVPATKAPTFWNRDAATGYFAGTLTGIPFAGLIGFVVGGFMGMHAMERDARMGKAVNPPTGWNKTLIIGAGIGLMAMKFMAAVAIVSGMASVSALALPLLGIELAAVVAGGFIGSSMGKTRLTQEYAQAQEYVAEHGNYVPSPVAVREQAKVEAVARAQAQQNENDILRGAARINNPATWADKVSADRAQETQQEAVR